MPSDDEYRKMEVEMREFCQGNIIIPNGVDVNNYLRRKVYVLNKKKLLEQKKKHERIGSIIRLINKVFKKR